MKIAILGGGISGLTAAYRLSKLRPDCEITVFEKKERLGGVMHTVRKGSFLFEEGPRTFSVSRSPELLSLIMELGLQEELIFSDPVAAKRFLWHRGKLCSAGSLFLKHAGSVALELFRNRKHTLEEESIHEFASRRFGKRIAELFFDSLVLGVFAGDAKQLSCQACFPKWAEYEERYGSLVKALFCTRSRSKDSLFTLRRGMGSLISALAKTSSCKIQLSTSVEALHRTSSHWEVKTVGGSFVAEAVFLALPYPEVRKLIDVPYLPHASLSVVNLGLRTSLAFRGYGYLVPSREKEDLLGMIWDSQVFPEQGLHRATAMVRFNGSDPNVVVLDALKRHLGFYETPQELSCIEYKEVIPQFYKGHSQRMLQIQNEHPSLYLLGNYQEGVSVEHCISRSNKQSVSFVSLNS